MIGRRHPHQTLFQRLEARHLVEDAVQVVQDLVHQGVEIAPHVGKVDAPGAAVDDLEAEGLLQFLMRPERADWVMNRLSAARVKLPVRATATKARNWRRLTFIGLPYKRIE